MSAIPLEFTLELTPRARVDVIDVRGEVSSRYGDALSDFPRALCCSFHTTAGYLDRSVASRLNQGPDGVMPYIDVFRTMFPEGAGYEHDKIERRTELSPAQRPVEPLNADSHLAFMAGALRTCVAYLNRPSEPMSFIDLDGVHAGRSRTRRTSVIGYTAEETVATTRIVVPVSGHSVESVNLKDPQLGVYSQVAALIRYHGVVKGRVRLSLAAGERHAGLTVNEYETLLMRHDLSEVLRDPLRFMAEKAGHMLGNPRAIPARTLDYAKYDLVRVFNRLLDALGLGQTPVENLLSRAIAMPASRFLRMKRSVSLLVSDRDENGKGKIIEGTYQSPILVQWHRGNRRARVLDVTITRFI
ncbi:MAG TPA: hypothetical protein VFT39_05645 [Vicinamibacterales bacterium]|nr:hypothetical protein [Vicinamibacterales bacterium]